MGYDKKIINFIQIRMRAYIIQISLLIFVVFTSCEKEINVDFDYDTSISNITYNEKNEFLRQENYYYKNNRIIRKDCTPAYIWNYNYDTNNNLTKYDLGNNCYFLYEYDSENKCIKEKQFVSDTLHLETQKIYLDTLLSKEIFFNKSKVVLSTTLYYYNTNRQLDSVIGLSERTYHYYTSNSHKIVNYKNNTKDFEKNTTFENGLISTYEESYFLSNGIKFQGQKETKKYDDKRYLVRLEIEHFEYYDNNTIYIDYRYSYNADGTLNKTELYDKDSKLVLYTECEYEVDKLVKKQSYDSKGNKTEHTIIQYTNKK
jgi:hypothetical protein